MFFMKEKNMNYRSMTDFFKEQYTIIIEDGT